MLRRAQAYFGISSHIWFARLRQEISIQHHHTWELIHGDVTVMVWKGMGMLRRAQAYFGIIPPAMMPSATSSRVWRMSNEAYLVAMSSLSFSTPGTSVIRISFSAWRAAAICKSTQLAEQIAAFTTLSVLCQGGESGDRLDTCIRDAPVSESMFSGQHCTGNRMC